jgi:hypothetical protein
MQNAECKIKMHNENAKCKLQNQNVKLGIAVSY